MANNIGENIQHLRNEQHMSQEMLAENLNISRQAISNWETGKTQPDTDTLIKISTLFQTSVDEIINGTASEKRPSKNAKGLLIVICSLVFASIHISFGIWVSLI